MAKHIGGCAYSGEKRKWLYWLIVASRTAVFAAAAAFPVALLLAFSAQSSASTPSNRPAAPCLVSIDAATVRPDETHTLVGSGFRAHQTVAVTVPDGAASSVITDANGAFRFTLRVPSTLAGDSWPVVAASPEATCSVNPAIAAAAPAQTSEQLSNDSFAFAGFPEIAAAMAGVFLAACGLLFLTIGRRRRS